MWVFCCQSQNMSTWILKNPTTLSMMMNPALISWEIGRKCAVKLLPLLQQKPFLKLNPSIDNSDYLMYKNFIFVFSCTISHIWELFCPLCCFISQARNSPGGLGIIWEVSETISLELLKNVREEWKKSSTSLTCHFDKRGRIHWWFLSQNLLLSALYDFTSTVASFIVLICNFRTVLRFAQPFVASFSSWESQQHLELILI